MCQAWSAVLGVPSTLLCALAHPRSLVFKCSEDLDPSTLQAGYENLSDHSIAAVAVTWQDLQVVGWDETCVCRRTCLCAWYSTWSLLKSFFPGFCSYSQEYQQWLACSMCSKAAVKCTTSQMAGDSSFWSLKHISGLTGPLAMQPPNTFCLSLTLNYQKVSRLLSIASFQKFS